VLARVLKKAVRTISPCLNGGSLPIHECVHFEDGVLWAVNGVGIIEVELDVHDVTASIPQKTLKAALRSFPASEDVEIVSAGEGIVLKSSVGTTTLAGISREDLPSRSLDLMVVAEAKVEPHFDRAFAGVAVAASTNETKPTLTGVLIELSPKGVGLTATDSYRLHHTDLEASVDGEATAICPVGYTKALPTVEPVAIQLAESHLRFTGGGVTVTLRSIEGEFPRYRQLIPTDTPQRALLDDASGAIGPTLETFDVLAGKQRGASVVELIFAPRAMVAEARLKLSDGGTHEARLPLREYSGEPLRIAFNPGFLREAVAFAGPAVAMSDGLRPVVLSSSGRYALLMPVRLS
jgi:DNA polymerase-3 subunit beta